jgi:hypothetical protein
VPTLSNLAPRPAGAPAVDISFRRFFTSAAAESRKTEAAWAETARRKTLQELTACIDSEFHDPSITAARLKEYDAKDQAAQNTEFNRCSCRTGFHHLCVAPGRGHGQRQWRYRFWADDILIHEYVTPDQDGQLHYGPARASRANENAQ